MEQYNKPEPSKWFEERYRDGEVKCEWDKPVRKNILKLANNIQDLPTAKVIPGDPEYRFLDALVTDEQCEVMLHMKLRVHYTAAELSKKCGKSEDEVARLLEECGMNGIVVVDPGYDPIEYHIPIYVPGMMEYATAKNEVAEKHLTGEPFSEYTIKRIIPLAGNLPVGRGVMRVIPIERAIDAGSHPEPYETVSHYIEKYDDIAISDCTCRRARRLMGEGCGHLEKDMCIALGYAARYFVRTGRARPITKEEAYEILRKAEENGLMHEIPNIDGNGETHGICNCCACSCFSMRTIEYFHTNGLLRSNYIAEVNKENCVACGQCVENCPVNAIKMGEKLCNKTPIAIPKPLDVETHKWGPKQWNPDYRFNREDIVHETGTAPCKTACPAHLPVQGYIKLAAEGRYEEALKLIKKNNPFPAVCGAICNRRCEDACTRGTIDEPIAIDEIKKFIAEQELHAEKRCVPEKRYDCSDKKIAVIGAGPAGLSCAYYLAQDNYDVTVFDKQEKPGGMLMYGIPSFRLEKDVVGAEIEVLGQLGVKFQMNTEVGRDVTLRELRQQGYKGFYIAIGAQGGRKLGVEGEDAEGVVSGVEFLRAVNNGKSEKLQGRTVVIGGGNVAVDVARTALRTGSDSVALYCLESETEMPAAADEVAETRAEGIAVNNGWGPKRIIVEDGHVRGIEFKRCVSVFDESHRFSPKYDENETVLVDCENILTSIGQSIEWGDLLKDEKVELGRGNTANADKLTFQTAQPDIFVGGDVLNGPKFAIDAIAQGKEGAISLHRYVQPGQSLLVGRDRYDYEEIDKDNIVVADYDNTPRQQVVKKEVADRFKDDRATFTEDQIRKETARCLGCGASVVDPTMCVGCGMCVTKCKFDAVHLKKVANVAPVIYEKIAPSSAPYMVKRQAKIAATAVKEKFTK